MKVISNWVLSACQLARSTSCDNTTYDHMHMTYRVSRTSHGIDIVAESIENVNYETESTEATQTSFPRDLRLVIQSIVNENSASPHSASTAPNDFDED
jgi:hypothetical protein